MAAIQKRARILLSKIDESKITIGKATNTIKIQGKKDFTTKTYFSSLFTEQNMPDKKTSQLYTYKAKGVVTLNPAIFGDENNKDKANSISLNVGITDEESVKLKEVQNKIFTEVYKQEYYQYCGNKTYTSFEEFIRNGTVPIVKENFKKDENKKLTKEKFPPAISIKMKFDNNDNSKFKDSIKFLDGKNGNIPMPVTPDNIADYIPRGTVCNLDIKFSKVSYSKQGVSVILELIMGSFNRPDRSNMFDDIPVCDDGEADVIREEIKNNLQVTGENSHAEGSTKHPKIVDSDNENQDIDDETENFEDTDEPAVVVTKTKGKKGKEPADPKVGSKKSKKGKESVDEVEDDE